MDGVMGKNKDAKIGFLKIRSRYILNPAHQKIKLKSLLDLLIKLARLLPLWLTHQKWLQNLQLRNKNNGKFSSFRIIFRALNTFKNNG